MSDIFKALCVAPLSGAFHQKRSGTGQKERPSQGGGAVGEITESRSLERAQEHLKRAIDELDEEYPEVAKLLEQTGEGILAVYELPELHRRRLRSTNMLERFHQEIKRRARIVRIFPNERPCIRLVSALAIETNEEWMQKRYLTITDQNEHPITTQRAPIA